MIEKILQKDLLVKVAAVILAFLIWGQQINLKNPATTQKETADIVLQAPEGKIIQSYSPTRVTITFSGRAGYLSKIKPEDLRVPIDISKAPNGQSTFPIVYNSPYQRVDVVDVTPKTATVTLAPRENKEVAVFVTPRGTPDKEFTADKPQFAVTSVWVTGAKNDVDRVASAAGEIDVTGAAGGMNGRVRLVAKDAAGNDVPQVEVQPSEIEVTVPMKQKQPAKRAGVRADTTGSPKNGYRLAGVTVSPDVKEIRGDPDVTGRIEVLHTSAIDISGKDAPFTATATLQVPAGITLETSARVTVNVDIQPDITTRTFSKVPVQIDNPPMGFQWDPNPRVVDVTLSHRSDILAQIKASDVQAYIDASSIDAADVGAKKDYPKIVQLRNELLPAGIGIDISPQSITLTLTKR